MRTLQFDPGMKDMPGSSHGQMKQRIPLQTL